MASPPMQGEGAPGPSIARSFIGLGVGEAAARLIAFATTLVIARRLGAEGLGIVSFAFAVLLYLQRVVDAGFDLGIGIREAAARRQNLRDFVPPVLMFRLALAAGLGPAFGPNPRLGFPGLQPRSGGSPVYSGRA